MSRNILIFSDGTGQAGGISFDENRSNIYKLYRATRVGPDSSINPAEQVAWPLPMKWHLSEEIIGNKRPSGSTGPLGQLGAKGVPSTSIRVGPLQWGQVIRPTAFDVIARSWLFGRSVGKYGLRAHSALCFGTHFVGLGLTPAG